MSKMKRISFFEDTIRIAVHSASDPDHVHRVMTIKEFANGDPVGLYETDAGELKAILFGANAYPRPQIFIEGPEV